LLCQTVSQMSDSKLLGSYPKYMGMFPVRTIVLDTGVRLPSSTGVDRPSVYMGWERSVSEYRWPFIHDRGPLFTIRSVVSVQGYFRLLIATGHPRVPIAWHSSTQVAHTPRIGPNTPNQLLPTPFVYGLDLRHVSGTLIAFIPRNRDTNSGRNHRNFTSTSGKRPISRYNIPILC
jgi:hypothetical protein